MTDYRICDPKMKYNGKAYIAKHHIDINIEKILIVFSHDEQPTKSKLILGRGNEGVSA